MINNVTLVGRMAVDPELKFTGSGKAVCAFRIAVDRQFKNADGEKDTDFINIVAWEKSAEFVANYIPKGDLLGVTGRLQIRKWVAQDGTKRETAEVVANDIRGLGGKKQPTGDQPESSGDAKATSNGKPKAAAPKAAAVAAPESDDETPDFHDPFADI